MTSESSVRYPAVAGQFYPRSESDLRREIEGCFLHPLGPGHLPKVNRATLGHPVGLVAPHAAYRYCAPVAACAFSVLATEGTPSAVVLLGPNHMGLGAALAIPKAARWRTPLGDMAIDRELRNALLARMPALRLDDGAHSGEHSLEMMLPFLQYLYEEAVRILPVAMADQTLSTSVMLGEALAMTLKWKNAAIIASSDFSHYVPHESAVAKDQVALDAILAMAPEQLYAAIQREGITMCGPGPIVAMLTACHHLGATIARLLSYATSGDTGGDRASVVGYAAVHVK